MMIILFPLSLVAADTGAAVVHTKGGVWVNGAEVADSTAIFPGDLLETKPGFVASLDAEGSSILIQPESLLKFQGSFVNLEHGSVSVGTSTAMAVHVNCIQVEPTSNERTQYDVSDTIGAVHVAATKNDVMIKQGLLQNTAKPGAESQSATLHEGEQATRDEALACGPPARPAGPGNFNPKWIEIGGGAAAGGLILCLLLCRSSSPSSVSPSQP